jgi:hypothetical protein
MIINNDDDRDGDSRLVMMKTVKVGLEEMKRVENSEDGLVYGRPSI